MMKLLQRNQRPVGLYSSALLFCAVAPNVLLKSRPVSEGMNSEWSGVEWSGVEWSGVEWSGVEWSGVEWSGVEWSGHPMLCYNSTRLTTNITSNGNMSTAICG